MSSSPLSRIAHDRREFEAFYREHVELVERFVARRVNDPHLAADLTADVFLAAIDSAGSYRGDRGTPTSWLYGIAQHVVADERRRAARDQRIRAKVEGRTLLAADDVERMQQRIDAAAKARELHAAIAALPAGERAVFELVALDELSTAEAAAALGIRPVTARVRLHRARGTLRRQVFDDVSPIISAVTEAS